MVMKRAERGATLAEIMAAVAWQAHSVRGFILETAGKKPGSARSSHSKTTLGSAYTGSRNTIGSSITRRSIK